MPHILLSVCTIVLQGEGDIPSQEPALAGKEHKLMVALKGMLSAEE
jgi:hypothetical protein